VPAISRFYGITIAMFTNDHPPPHFHARYGEDRARFLLDGRLLDGSLPRRAHQLVQTWARLHSQELRECWNRASRREHPGTIEPLR
jgi:hypothetical protein